MEHAAAGISGWRIEKGTSKNYPFAIWTDLVSQLFILKTPQYTKYSGIFKI